MILLKMKALERHACHNNSRNQWLLIASDLPFTALQLKVIAHLAFAIQHS